ATAWARWEGDGAGGGGVRSEPVQVLRLHAATPPTGDATDGKRQVDPLIATGEVTDLAWPLIIEAREALATHAALRFFRRRRKVRRTAWGSASRSWIRARGGKTGERHIA